MDSLFKWVRLSRALQFLLSAFMVMTLAACPLDGSEDNPSDEPGMGPDPDPDPDPDPEEEDIEGSLRLLTYNVADISITIDTVDPPLEIDIDSTFDSKLTFPQIKTLLEEDPYDLVLLQENFNEARQSLLTPDPAIYPDSVDTEGAFLQVLSLIPLQAEGDGMIRYGNIEDVEYERINWSTCAGGISDDDMSSGSDCLTTKGFSYAEYTLGEGDNTACLVVYNLHMDAGSLVDDVAAREAQTQMLIQDIEERSEAIGECALILGGDFNYSEDLSDLGTDGNLEQLLSATGTKDVCLELECSQPDKIDRFLYRDSDKIQLSAKEWAADERFDESDEGGPLSDHQAVRVVFDYTIPVQ